jgi:hypothetical protein
MRVKCKELFRFLLFKFFELIQFILLCRTMNLKPQEKWPDWKCDDKSSRCGTKSDKLLGKLYRNMNEEIDKFQFHTDDREFPIQINDYIDSHLKENLNSFTEHVTKSIMSYCDERQGQLRRSFENFYIWKNNYCLKFRENFITNKFYDPDRIPLLHAAVFYKQCFIMENKRIVKNACEFAWLVCQKELIEIFAGKNGVTVSTENVSIFLQSGTKI